jgi:hypothetical protein
MKSDRIFFATVLFVVAMAGVAHEPIAPSFLTGALMMLVGIVLVSGYGWLRQLAGALTALRKSS